VRGSAFDVHDDLLRWKRNEIDSGDETGIDIVRIFWFAAARKCGVRISHQEKRHEFSNPGDS
jgi:hypothetical protein